MFSNQNLCISGDVLSQADAAIVGALGCGNQALQNVSLLGLRSTPRHELSGSYVSRDSCISSPQLPQVPR